MPGEDIFHSPEKKNTLSPEMFKNIIKQRKDRRPISWNSAIKKLRQIACNVYNVSSWKRVRKCPDLINAPFGPLIKKLYRTQPVQRLRGALESFMRHRVRSITRADVPPAPPPQKKANINGKTRLFPRERPLQEDWWLFGIQNDSSFRQPKRHGYCCFASDDINYANVISRWLIFFRVYDLFRSFE